MEVITTLNALVDEIIIKVDEASSNADQLLNHMEITNDFLEIQMETDSFIKTTDEKLVEISAATDDSFEQSKGYHPSKFKQRWSRLQ